MPTPLETKLAQAETALHKLMTGTAARVFVDIDGSRVEYVAANRAALIAYINDLRAQVAAEGGTAVAPNYAPAQFYF